MRKSMFPMLLGMILVGVGSAFAGLEPAKNEYRIVSPVPSGSTVTMIEQPSRLDSLQGKTLALVGGSFSASTTGRG